MKKRLYIPRHDQACPDDIRLEFNSEKWNPIFSLDCIGITRAKALLKYFGTFERFLDKASYANLFKLRNIGKSAASDIMLIVKELRELDSLPLNPDEKKLIPIANVWLATHLGYYWWVVPKCPICGQRHSMSAGTNRDCVDEFLGLRVIHCDVNTEHSQYFLREFICPHCFAKPKQFQALGDKISLECGSLLSVNGGKVYVSPNCTERQLMIVKYAFELSVSEGLTTCNECVFYDSCDQEHPRHCTSGKIQHFMNVSVKYLTEKRYI